jgi:hypothetical protein
VSKSGKNCLDWIDSSSHLVGMLPDDRTADSRNYCRFVPRQNWTRPSCIVPTATGHGQFIEECDVPYCGGLSVAVSICICNLFITGFQS